MTRFATVSCLALLPTTFSSTTSCSCNPRARRMFLGNWILPSASIRATILMSAIGYTPVSTSPAPLPWQTWQYSTPAKSLPLPLVPIWESWEDSSVTDGHCVHGCCVRLLLVHAHLTRLFLRLSASIASALFCRQEWLQLFLPCGYLFQAGLDECDLGLPVLLLLRNPRLFPLQLHQLVEDIQGALLCAMPDVLESSDPRPSGWR